MGRRIKTKFRPKTGYLFRSPETGNLYRVIRRANEDWGKFWVAPLLPDDSLGPMTTMHVGLHWELPRQNHLPKV